MIDTLRAELERLFELEELMTLCRDLLGVSPEAVGGTAALASFAKALTEYAADEDALEALAEAVHATQSGVSPSLEELRHTGLPDLSDFHPGSTLGAWQIDRKLGENPSGTSFLATREGQDYRLHLLRLDATRDRRALNRFLVVTRLMARVQHPGLPQNLQAESIELALPEPSEGADGGATKLAKLGRNRWVVCQRWTDGQLLSDRVARTGPLHMSDARPILKGILEALIALHERQLAHGALSLSSVLLPRGSTVSPIPLLLDGGMDRLRLWLPTTGNGLLTVAASPASISPEQLRGKLPDARSDTYSFGAVLYELLTGKTVFGSAKSSGGGAIEAAVGHLTLDPPPPSTVAPRGWVSRELDEFVLRLLAKDPKQRPADASDILGELDNLGHAILGRGEAKISEADLTQRIEFLIDNPTNPEAAIALEATVDAGADPKRVAESFEIAADGLDSAEQETKVRHLFRAARLREAARQLDSAELIYVTVLELDPQNGPATAALESVRRRLGKYEELVEMLLKRGEEASSGSERARALAEIGRVYVHDLEDKDQAVAAFTQAYCEDPRNQSYAQEVEKLGAGNPKIWEEVLSTCVSVASDPDLPIENKNIILCKMGDWYLDKVQRPDLALPVYQSVLATEPASDHALRGLTQIYRKAQQWQELGMVLTSRADAAATPSLARDLRCEAAELLELQLNDTATARSMYEQILAEDPGHARASDALARLYERTGDLEGFVKILLRRADGERGEEKHKTLCRIAEIYEVGLKNDAEATQRYRAVLELDDANLDALRGLDRLYSKAGRFKDLLENLEKQIQRAATPRQRITLLERLAGIYDEEFLDHRNAICAWEAILEIDKTHAGALAALPRHYRSLDRWEPLAEFYERQARVLTDPKKELDVRLALGRVLAEQLGSPERAMVAYERVLELDAHHSGALEALARLRETVGDADAALSAILSLAEKAATPEAKAEHYVRAAKLLENRGARDAAIEQYRRALEELPTDSGISSALRAAYVARGDVTAALQLIEKEYATAEGETAKGRLSAQMAQLCREKLKDNERAETAAKRAMKHDPSNLDARIVLGDIAFDDGRHLEASKHYEVVADRAASLDPTLAIRILVRYVDALSQAGSTEKALSPVETLLRIAPDNLDALSRVAKVIFEHGAPARAAELYLDLFERFGDRLKSDADNLYRYGESLRRVGETEEAVRILTEAADADPSSGTPLLALAHAYEGAENWEQALRAKTRHLDIAEGEERFQLLIEIGEMASSKLNDRNRAAKSYVAALEEHPDDRRLLSKLMQLYSEGQDWEKLVDVVLRLAEFVGETLQKAKYLQTAAIVCSRQLRDYERALDFYHQVIELDPTNEKALSEAIELEKASGKYEEVEELLQVRLNIATKADDKPKMIATFTELGELYENQLGWVEKAIDAYEAAQTLDPNNLPRTEKLTALYTSDPARYLAKAVESQFSLLKQNPYRAESYKTLRRLYTETKNADAAFCLCQALTVLNLAEPDEERFFKRMRADTAAPAREAISDDDWLSRLFHEDADPLLTGVFALIEPAVIGKRSQSIEGLGYDAHYRIDLARHPYPMSQNLFYAAGVLGTEAPPTYQNPNDLAGLSFLHAHTPSIVLGRAAMASEIPPQAAAFIAARHLAYFRPGLYIRQLVPTGTGLKAWLFAAIKLISPQFPIAPELEGPVKDALSALEVGITGGARDQLARVVSRLLQSGKALDLKRWVAGVDLTADRVGLVVAHDLETAAEIIRASDDTASAVPRDERFKQLVLFSASKPFFDLRKRLGISVDT